MAETIKIGGRLHSTATGNVVAGANEILDDAKGKKQSVVNAENDIQLASHESRLNAYTEGKFVTVSNYSALPATGAVDTVYRVSSWDGTANNGQGAVDVTKYSEYAWQNGAYKFLDVKTQIGEVFDISEYNSGAVYTDLANALGNNGINVPSFIRRGGMSVKFKQVITPATYTVVKIEGATEQPTGTELQSDPGIISGTYTAGELSVFSTLPATINSSLTYYLAVTEQEVTTYTTWVITYVHTSDNKYVQYTCFSDEFTTDVTKWAICYSGVYINNKKYVYALLDGLDKVLWAVENNGNIYYGAGVPQQIIDYVAEKIAELQLDKVEDIVTFLGDLLEGDKTLLQLFNEKVDKEEGKGLIDNKIKDTLFYTENSDYVSIEKDGEDKFLSGRKQNGTKEENCPVELMGNRFETKDTIHIEEELDSNEKGLSYRKKNGTLVENAGIETPHIEAENAKAFNGDFVNLSVEELWKGYKSQMESLNRSMIPADHGGQFPVSTYKPLVLSVITDTHNYNESIKRFLDFNIKYAGYIDASLHIGDICQSNWMSYQEFVEDYDGYKNMMISIGNHDVYHYDGGDNWATDAQKFARYMKYIKNWGVHYTEDKCYYYKDFLYGNIRLIVLDCMGWDADQKTWFTNTLADAKTKSLHVIVAEHIPVVNSIIDPQNSKQLLNYKGFDCTFESREIYTMAFNETQCNPNAAVVVQHFIDGTDEFANVQGEAVFVTWLFGHWHTDSVGVLTNYPNQMYIAQGGDVAGRAPFEDTQRTSETILQDLYNVIGVDYITKTLTVLRIGANIDRHLRKKEVLVVSYEKDNIKVINNY